MNNFMMKLMKDYKYNYFFALPCLIFFLFLFFPFIVFSFNYKKNYSSKKRNYPKDTFLPKNARDNLLI